MKLLKPIISSELIKGKQNISLAQWSLMIRPDAKICFLSASMLKGISLSITIKISLSTSSVKVIYTLVKCKQYNEYILDIVNWLRKGIQVWWHNKIILIQSRLPLIPLLQLWLELLWPDLHILTLFFMSKTALIVIMILTNAHNLVLVIGTMMMRLHTG